jgi:predicted  nucleic acid-binding Zn-ribbon protein
MGRSHKGIRKEVRALDATFEDLEDELDDLRKVKDFDDLEDLEDEARKLVKKGQRLKEKLPQVRLTPTTLSNWRKTDDQLKRLDRLLSSWREG